MQRVLLVLSLLITSVAQAQSIQVKNPLMWTDAPDPDIIRVGDYYYLVTTTMHLFPGGPVMRSRDLAHWEPSPISLMKSETHLDTTSKKVRCTDVGNGPHLSVTTREPSGPCSLPTMTHTCPWCSVQTILPRGGLFTAVCQPIMMHRSSLMTMAGCMCSSEAETSIWWSWSLTSQARKEEECAEGYSSMANQQDCTREAVW